MRIKKSSATILSLFFIVSMLQALTEKQMNTIQNFTQTDYRTWDKTSAEGYLKQVQRGLKTAVRTARASLKTYEKRLKKGLALLEQQDQQVVTKTKKPETRDVATQTEPWLEQLSFEQPSLEQQLPPEPVIKKKTKAPKQPLPPFKKKEEQATEIPPSLEAEAHAAALELVTQ